MYWQGVGGNWKPVFHQLLKPWGFFRLEKKKLEDKGWLHKVLHQSFIKVCIIFKVYIKWASTFCQAQSSAELFILESQKLSFSFSNSHWWVKISECNIFFCTSKLYCEIAQRSGQMSKHGTWTTTNSWKKPKEDVCGITLFLRIFLKSGR